MEDGEKARIKGLLNDQFDVLKKPNPLETLGITPEAANELGVDGVTLAAKGLYRAWQSRLHPDQNPDATEKTSARQRVIQEAQETFEADPKTVLESYVRRKKKPTPKPTSRGKSYPPVITSRPSSSEIKRADALNLMIKGLYSPESVTNVATAEILVKRHSMLPQDHDSFMSVSYNNEEATFQSMHYAGAGEQIPEQLIPYTTYEKSPYIRGVLVTPDSAFVVDEGSFSPLTEVANTDLDQGWYTLRGVDQQKSLAEFKKRGASTKHIVKLLGFVSIDFVKTAQRGALATGSTHLEAQALIAGEQSTKKPLGKKFDKRFSVDTHWEPLQNGYLYEEFGFFLNPKPGNENVLLAMVDGEPTQLGSIEHAIFNYKT